MTFIYSKFAADQDWQELLQDLVNNIPQRLEAIDAAVASGDVRGLSFLVHQMKGACGSYGFDEVTALARQLESVLQRGSELSACQTELASFRTALQSMTDQPAPTSTHIAR